MRIAAAKRKQRERNAMWQAALADGRVVRRVVRIYPEQTTLTAYPTIEARDAAIATSGGQIVTPVVAEIIRDNPTPTTSVSLG